MRLLTGESGMPTLVVRRAPNGADALVRDLRVLVQRHPVAIQAICRMLVAEGRRFVETPDGRAWRQRLAGSELVRRGRMLWEGSALDLLDDRGESRLPTAFVDTLIGVLTSTDFVERLRRAAE